MNLIGDFAPKRTPISPQNERRPPLSRKMSCKELRRGFKVSFMTRYSDEFKNTVIAKILSDEAPSMHSVAKEYDILIATVFNWLRNVDENSIMNDKSEKPASNESNSAVEHKFKVIIETASLTPEEVSAYCRGKGIYTQDIEAWKQEMMDNLDPQNKKRLFSENKNLKIKLRELQAELRCKDKALAEASALLLLKKKARIIWGDPEDEKLL
jgi:transposase